MTRHESFRQLVEVMERLRSPDGGCPWDLEQTPKSLKPYIVEEAYEVLDAIDTGDPAVLCEELGDLLLQVVFQAQLGAESGAFTIDDVAQAISDKMIRRHPHVFGDNTDSIDAEQVQNQWELRKAAEGKRALSGVPRALPSLLRAVRVTDKASRVGFDWTVTEEVLDKVIEEVEELREALKEGRQEEIEAELGDLLFSLANFGRHVGVEPEDALRSTIDRFTTRFEWVENILIERGEKLGSTPLEELEALWQQAKEQERA